jgi:hypothetical protein
MHTARAHGGRRGGRAAVARVTAVLAAAVLWDVLADGAEPAYAQGTIDATDIRGNLVESGPSPCWEAGFNLSYEADVTAAVTGNGEYNLTNFASGLVDGSDPWTSDETTTPPLLEGATLVVVYQDSSLPQSSVQLDAGAAESDSGSSADATLRRGRVRAAGGGDSGRGDTGVRHRLRSRRR